MKFSIVNRFYFDVRNNGCFIYRDQFQISNGYCVVLIQFSQKKLIKDIEKPQLYMSLTDLNLFLHS